MLKENKNYKILVGIIIGILLSGTIVYAATLYEGSSIFYDNSNSDLSSTNVQDALDELYGMCYVSTSADLNLGDYVSLTPIKSSYTTSTTYTGYTSTQTINPQELNLWRVISLNDDGTVDLISEHVSSVAVYFRGQTGYMNFVGYLNVLASQYENSNYTTGSRYFGYNGQTEYITDTSMFTYPAPWTCDTGDSGCDTVESQGGGDTLYTTDYELVYNVLGTRVATNPSGTKTVYWIASRYYDYISSAYHYWYGRIVSASGSLTSSNNLLYSYINGFNEYSRAFALRPILTLKSTLTFTGSGTEAEPFVPIG